MIFSGISGRGGGKGSFPSPAGGKEEGEGKEERPPTGIHQRTSQGRGAILSMRILSMVMPPAELISTRPAPFSPG